MKITKAVITAAGKQQRTLPLQTLIDRDGIEKSVLGIIIEEVLRAGIDEICVVVRPGDEDSYAGVAGDHAGRLHFAHQTEPLGHGHAVYSARNFVGNDSFCTWWAITSTSAVANRAVRNIWWKWPRPRPAPSPRCSPRENLLPYYGAIGGRRIAGRSDFYQVETVIEKPTPTEAEQRLIIPGLRTGHYLCFFGMHVLTPTIFAILERRIAERKTSAASAPGGLTLTEALAELARREQYLALEKHDARYDVGVKYGLLTAQLALSMSGQDRDEVLSMLLELLAQRKCAAPQINGWR
ncbi:MAG: UTP--glucose-1-phosphate uridylyltransferase [Caldilineaceae bacterium]